MSRVEHITDFSRRDGDWTLCSLPLPRYTIGSGRVCQVCADRFKGRKRGGGKWTIKN